MDSTPELAVKVCVFRSPDGGYVRRFQALQDNGSYTPWTGDETLFKSVEDAVATSMTDAQRHADFEQVPTELGQHELVIDLKFFLTDDNRYHRAFQVLQANGQYSAAMGSDIAFATVEAAATDAVRQGLQYLQPIIERQAKIQHSGRIIA